MLPHVSGNVIILLEAVVCRCSVKKVCLGILQKSWENNCLRVRPQACNFIKKETMAQVFSCEFCKISKNTFFIEHFWRTVFVLHLRFTMFRRFAQRKANILKNSKIKTFLTLAIHVLLWPTKQMVQSSSESFLNFGFFSF